MKHVVVVGAGIAGTAAALAAARVGARVTVVSDGPGASVLSGGALDDVAWEDRGHERGLGPWIRDGVDQAVLDAFDAYVVNDESALILATTGLVRPARGVDRALLDLADLARIERTHERTTVLVPDYPARASWDAPSLVRSWAASSRAATRLTDFVAVPTSLLLRTEEHSFPDADLAALHDDPARLAWLGDRLRDARASFAGEIGAIVLPPWLGVVRERATALTKYVGVRCGEALGSVGGPSGLRFEHARDAAFVAAGITSVSRRALRAIRIPGEYPWRVEVLGDEGHIDADAVVLATGGLLGGGLEYTPTASYFATDVPTAPRPLMRITCEAPAQLGALGRPLEDPSSLFGAAPESHAWPYVESPLLGHAGILIRDDGEVVGASSGLYGAGELVADRPRTWLAALRAGATAGENAARG